MSELKFEVGKNYRTRAGEKLLCAHVFPGKILLVNELARTYGTRWPDGMLSSSMSGPHDIVGEWREPRQWTVYVVEYSDGQVEETMNPGRRKILAKRTLTEGEGLE